MDVFDLVAKISLDSSEYDNGLDAAGKKASGFGDKIKSGLATAGKVGAAAIGAATAAAGAFAASSISVGSEFDAGMSRVAAISGKVADEDLPDIIDAAKEMGLTFEDAGDATSTALGILRAKAMEMGATTKFSATEASDAMNYMAMAGWKAEDMLGGIEGIMNLAAASGEDLATTSDIVTDALTAFGLSAKDSGHFADVLAMASSNANTNVSMMGDTFKYVAPVAGALGYSAEDTAVAIGLMANAGIKSSQAGTALRGALSRLAKPTEETEKAMRLLGVSLTDEEGNMKSLMDIMGDMRSGFSSLKISEEDYNSSVADLEKKLASGAIGAGDYRKAMSDLEYRLNGSEGAMKAEIAAMLAGQEGMSGLLAIVNASNTDFQKLTDSIYNADGAAKQMAITMQDNLAGDITIMKSALEGAQIVLSDVMTPALREFVQFGTEGISSLTQAFQEEGLAGAMGQLGVILSDAVAMLVEQLPVFIDAGIQLVGALGQGIIDNLPMMLDAALEIINMLVTNISESLPKMADSAIEIITSLADGITEAIPQLIPVAVDTILQLVETLTDPDNLSSLFDSAIELILSLADGLIDAVPKLIEKLPVIIGNLVEGFVENAPKMIVAAAELILKLAEGLITSIPTLIMKIPEIIAAIIDGFINGASDIIDIGKNIVSGIWEGISGMGNWIKDKVGGFFGGIVDGVKGFLGIHSPSTVFADMGKNMALGLGEGWDNEFSDIQSQIKGDMDFGTSSVDFASSGLGALTAGVAASGAAGGEEVVIPVTLELDGDVLVQKTYRRYQNEGSRIGPAMVQV